MRIDLHTHVLPPPYRALLTDNADPAAASTPPPEQLLADIDRWEIDATVISLGGAPDPTLDLATALRTLNEGYADLVRAHPKRLGALASVPLPDVDAALAELEYALDTLKLDGVLLLSNHQGVYLGDPRLDPFFEELERRSAYCFVHPDFPPSSPLPHPGRWYEFPFDTTRAMVNMALNGAFDRYPNVRVQWAHLGGTIPFLARRIDSQSARMTDVVSGMEDRMMTYFRRQWYDTGLAPYYGMVAAARDLVPIEKLVFGTDWPWFPRPEHGTDPQPQLDAVGPDRVKIDHLNAHFLVPALVERLTA